jgi:hypothetical protein
MKKIIVLALFFLLSLPILSQEKDNDDEDSPRYRKIKVGGAGGVTPILGFFDHAEINKALKIAGLPTLGSDPMYLIGGEGYGYIMFLKNVRFGGAGIAGKKSVTAYDTSSGVKLQKDVDYTISYGGFLIDYVIPVADRLDIAVGFTIGGGSVNIEMRRDDGAFKDFNPVWTEYGSNAVQTKNYTRRLSGSFAAFQPHAQVEYALLPWLQLRLGASYPIMFSPEWKLDDQYKLNNVPANLKASGYTVNAGIMFGYFN